MHFVSDFHLHSKYSRAVSPRMTLPFMAQYAAQKGIDILTAGDWTHPVWFQEISAQLTEAGEGVYKLKYPISNFKFTPSGTGPISNGEQRHDILFLLSTEIASIYKQGGRLRRIHSLVFVPDFWVAVKVTKELLRRGCNLSADGRPMVGISAKHLLEMLLSIDERCLLIPCHIWTPHFGIYGSASGFDSMEECFGSDLVKHVYGIETGISSDPGMNWQVEELRYRSILSFSDAHSAPKMAREATVFVDNTDENGISNFKYQISNIKSAPDSTINDKFNISYKDVRLAIMRKKEGRLKIGYTIEFYPEEGKYHFSGHRNCKVVAGPEEIRAGGNLCSVCQKRLTEGVLYRVQQLMNDKLLGREIEKKDAQGVKWYADKLQIQPPYVKLVPLLEVVAESMNSSVASQKSQKMFADLCLQLGSEISILLYTQLEEITKIGGSRVAEGVRLVREGNIAIDPGYDGKYGIVRIWEKQAKAKKDKRTKNQLGLF